MPQATATDPASDRLAGGLPRAMSRPQVRPAVRRSSGGSPPTCVSIRKAASAVSFKAWMARLRDEGYLVCPGSSAVPVEIRGVRPDGVGLHFRCRGTSVRLAVYRPGRAAWQVAVRDEGWCPEEALQLWAHRPLDGPPPTADARLAFPGDAGPDQELVVDGARAWGWSRHEAGLLRPTAAAYLFDHLLATLVGSGAQEALGIRGQGGWATTPDRPVGAGVAPARTGSPARRPSTPRRAGTAVTVGAAEHPGRRADLTEVALPAARSERRDEARSEAHSDRTVRIG
ncbi:hypothetical protein FF36_00525 [Frankia torreyi]|uniref:Uncharacterized protein n=1 Tax=Frankia torreyi TaxID=1856 RepID=A0A0D8BLD6_9ACTN|nr:hypothetical protein FF36_00525 [Frankia torreyi]